jgi:hypothetical protein
MSVISIPRLPNQVDVNFGPTDAVSEVILGTDRSVRNVGIRLSLSSDFHDLQRINQQNRVDWYPLTPNFDPDECDRNASNAFWLRGIDDRGDVVLCHAVRLYALHQDLKGAVEDLSFYYDDTDRARAAGVHTTVTATAAAMSGRVAYSGALWVRSDFRGFGLARLIPPLSRTLALTRWYPANHTCFLMQPTVEKGMAKVYGYDNLEYAITLGNMPGFPSSLNCALCWKTADAVTEEIETQALRLQDRVGIGLEGQRGHEPSLVV